MMDSDYPEAPCEEGCTRCSGEYCDVHFCQSCDCDVVERHASEHAETA